MYVGIWFPFSLSLFTNKINEHTYSYRGDSYNSAKKSSAKDLKESYNFTKDAALQKELKPKE